MIELPYPPSKLNPNRKGHWAIKARATKEYRRECGWAAKFHPPMKRFMVKFHPPDKRPRDVDNVIAACKSLVDGLQDAWHINDRDFEIIWPTKFSEPVKNGKIVVEGI